MSFAQSLKINADSVRIRSFDFNGQTIRVRVPLTTEADALYEKIKEPSAELVKQKYEELSTPLLAKRKEIEETDSEIKYLEDDIVLAGTSIKELAKSQAEGETRILETFRLLVPADGKDMSTLTYEEINADLPLPIQLELVKKISEVISPNYEESRKN
jgi:cellobiose-specific phosphotransferase system component IIA